MDLFHHQLFGIKIQEYSRIKFKHEITCILFIMSDKNKCNFLTCHTHKFKFKKPTLKKLIKKISISSKIKL